MRTSIEYRGDSRHTRRSGDQRVVARHVRIRRSRHSRTSESRAWKMVTTPDPSVLRLRLTNVPGWRATIDGKPVDIDPFARIMLQVRVPPGRHVVELQYWPKTFSVGIVLALSPAFGLAIF